MWYDYLVLLVLVIILWEMSKSLGRWVIVSAINWLGDWHSIKTSRAGIVCKGKTIYGRRKDVWLPCNKESKQIVQEVIKAGLAQPYHLGGCVASHNDYVKISHYFTDHQDHAQTTGTMVRIPRLNRRKSQGCTK